ncbi:MAG TPA: amidohydrolase [Candidatus Limnocylindria bacterium]
MTSPRATTVLIGQVVVSASPEGIRTAEAVGLADGRVIASGSRDGVLSESGPTASVLDFGTAAIVPGLCDFHLHLIGMARARREVRLDDAQDAGAIVAAMADAAARLSMDGWLRGRGWHDAVLAATDRSRLEAAIGRRPALVYSHDGHSAWASPAALAAAGVSSATPDPAGGRIERDARGEPTGVLRERAADILDPVAGGLTGTELQVALRETLTELASLGITSAVDAGDATAEGGTGRYAALGDRALILLQSDVLDGRLRLSANLPADAIGAAAEHGLRTGDPVAGRATMHIGWAKVFVDGALGSRTAALFEPYTCGEAGDAGIARLSAEELEAIVRAARGADIGLAIHAIGDRGAAMVLDALTHEPRRTLSLAPDRMEHLQLLRPEDVPRLAAADITASVQPVHCASDRELVDRCWSDRAARAYPWRDLQRAGTRLAFGSDAPIESPNPWLGVFAALHRRFPGDGTDDWQPQQTLNFAAALAGYTSGSADAAGWPDRGHLRPGAHADLAVLDRSLDDLMRGSEDLADVRSQLTLLAGEEIHRA